MRPAVQAAVCACMCVNVCATTCRSWPVSAIHPTHQEQGCTEAITSSESARMVHERTCQQRTMLAGRSCCAIMWDQSRQGMQHSTNQPCLLPRPDDRAAAHLCIQKSGMSEAVRSVSNNLSAPFDSCHRYKTGAVSMRGAGHATARQHQRQNAGACQQQRREPGRIARRCACQELPRYSRGALAQEHAQVVACAGERQGCINFPHCRRPNKPVDGPCRQEEGIIDGGQGRLPGCRRQGIQ